MKLKSLFSSMSKKKQVEIYDDAYYDEYVDFYYSNLINALILFTLSKKELKKLETIAFDPIFELESEIDYAFTPVCFETVFRNEKIGSSQRQPLLDFKQKTDQIPKKIWGWEFIETHETWISLRMEANQLLDAIGITHRTYNDDYTTVYNTDGNLLKTGKTVNS